MKIAAFYHIYQYGPWEHIFNEQWSLITKSNLLDVCNPLHIGINGNVFGETGNPRIKVKLNRNPDRQEADTLIDLANFAYENPDYKILYFHTKGVSNMTKMASDWRNLMNYFCIEKWRDCVKLLDEHDAVGCNLLDYPDNDIIRPHFSGNFWWANASYINQLDRSFLYHPNRFAREFWIGTAHGDLYEIHNSGVNHYDKRYPRENYASD